MYFLIYRFLNNSPFIKISSGLSLYVNALLFIFGIWLKIYIIYKYVNLPQYCIIFSHIKLLLIMIEYYQITKYALKNQTCSDKWPKSNMKNLFCRYFYCYNLLLFMIQTTRTALVYKPPFVIIFNHYINI